MRYDYVTDGTEIYRRSFEIIRAEADLSGMPVDVADVAVRMIHAAAQTDLPASMAWSDGFVTAARRALNAGAPILCDSQMVASGIIRSRLPGDNEVVCLLGTPEVAAHAADRGDQLGHGVLGGHRVIEDGGIQCPPGLARQHRGLRDHRSDRLEDPVRAIRGRQPAPPIGQGGGVKCRCGDRQPARGFPPQIEGDRVHGLVV